MPVSQPNIVLVLPRDAVASLQFPDIKGYHGQACLAGESWATNFVSLLSSSVPSHHQVWSGNGKMGIHVDPLPIALKKAAYRSCCICPRDAESIAAQCGFDEVIVVEDRDGTEETRKVLDQTDESPKFITCVPPVFSTRWQDLASSLIAKKDGNVIVVFANLASSSRGDGVISNLVNISTPFIFTRSGTTTRLDESRHLWSIIDITPSILGLLKIKVPYTMVGKDLHMFWLGKSKKSISFPRERCLFEHDDGSKTTWNSRFLFTVHPGKADGELYDIEHEDGREDNLWADPAVLQIKNTLMLEFLWAQLDKECMPMPRIAGA